MVEVEECEYVTTHMPRKLSEIDTEGLTVPPRKRLVLSPPLVDSLPLNLLSHYTKISFA